jgi:hypothetical protein
VATPLPTPVKDYFHRAIIDENGNFQQYVYHKRNGTKWERVWRAIDDPCRVDFVCGIYGLCTSPNNLWFSALVLCCLRLFVVGDMLSHIRIMMRMKEEVKMMIWFLLIWF